MFFGKETTNLSLPFLFMPIFEIRPSSMCVNNEIEGQYPTKNRN
jgi:hypothetical protein